MSEEPHARRRWLLFPGMNPQGNVFEKLAPLVGECELIEWRLPKNQSSIADLAAEIVTELQIDENCDLLGVSFGGVVAQEVHNCPVRQFVWWFHRSAHAMSCQQ